MAGTREWRKMAGCTNSFFLWCLTVAPSYSVARSVRSPVLAWPQESLCMRVDCLGSPLCSWRCGPGKMIQPAQHRHAHRQCQLPPTASSSKNAGSRNTPATVCRMRRDLAGASSLYPDTAMRRRASAVLSDAIDGPSLTVLMGVDTRPCDYEGMQR